MISVKEAQNKVLEAGRIMGTAKVPLLGSLNLVLSEDIVSDDDIPVYDNSAMDGYAVRAEDTKGADKSYPVRLTLMDEDIPAGKVPTGSISSGCCIPIMTGAPIPQKCTAVVRKEDTEKTGAGILIYKECGVGENIRYRGEDIKKGDTVLAKGRKIFPADIGVMASLGRARVPVYRPPVVGIISTGDEIVPIGKKLEAGRVRDSNSYSLSAQVKELGIKYIRYGIVKDKKRLMEEKILEGLSECNILLLSGGVSVGDYDFVKDTLLGLGAELVFWKVNQKPGKPLLFLTYRDRLVFGLPGNPVSVMVCFEMYVRPLIKKMTGDSILFRPRVTARAAHDFKHKKGRTNFARVVLEKKEEGYFFSSTGRQGSGILTSMARADGIAVFAEETGDIKKGSEAEVFLLKPVAGRIQHPCR
ncbi:MAG: gephyrin-like molybdotransferase Glp [Actinomycetota bacterium]